MRIQWTTRARGDLERLHSFLAKASAAVAARAIRALVSAPERLVERPRIGEALEEFEPREVRHLFIGKCEMRYEIQGATIYILRVWHAREHR